MFDDLLKGHLCHGLGGSVSHTGVFSLRVRRPNNDHVALGMVIRHVETDFRLWECFLTHRTDSFDGSEKIKIKYMQTYKRLNARLTLACRP